MKPPSVSTTQGHRYMVNLEKEEENEERETLPRLPWDGEHVFGKSREKEYGYSHRVQLRGNTGVA